MLSASREERRAYIRESANRLASLLALALSRQTAHTLLQGFSELAESSERIGAEVYIPLLAACQDLCSAAEREFPDEKTSSKANELLKEAVINIQTSLFSVALFGDMEKDRARLNESRTEIQQFLKNGGFGAPPAPLASIAGSLDEDTLSLLATPAERDPRAGSELHPELHPEFPAVSRVEDVPRPGGGRTWSEARLSSHPQVLAAIERLLLKSWPGGNVAPELIELVAVARANYGLSFGEICRRLSAETGFAIEPGTPAFLIETGLVAAISEQIREWLKPQQLTLTGVSASARQTGRTITLELCVRGRFVLTPEWLPGAGERASPASGNPEEYQLTRQGELLHRTSFDPQLSLFEAYEIRLGTGRFLLPASDVLDPAPPEDASFEQAVKLDSPDLASRAGSARVALRWRDRTALVRVDAISGPGHFLPKKLLSPDSRGQGIVGIAWAAGLPGPGARGPASSDESAEEAAHVLDTHAWLDSLASQRKSPAFPQSPENPAPWFVFELGGGKFALPAGSVAGKAEPGSLAARGVYFESSDAVYRRVELLGGLPPVSSSQPAPSPRAGGAGGFLLIRCRHGIVALAVDGMEGGRALTPLPADLSRQERELATAWVAGNASDPVSGEKVVLINPDGLVPAFARDQRSGDAA